MLQRTEKESKKRLNHTNKTQTYTHTRFGICCRGIVVLELFKCAILCCETKILEHSTASSFDVGR